MSAFPADDLTDLRSQLKELKTQTSPPQPVDISQDDEVKEYLRVLNKTRKMDAGHRIYSKVTLD